MITDPRTVPSGRVGRILFGVLVAVASTMLMAPQTNEFGTKVALLAGLVVVCAARPLIERVVPAAGSVDDVPGRFARRVAIGSRGGVMRPVVRLGVVAAAVVVVGAGLSAAGSSSRGTLAAPLEDVLGRVPDDVDPATLPTITVEPDVSDLAANLELENRALLRSDPSILDAVDHGDRLDEMRRRIDDATAAGEVIVERYQFDEVTVTLLEPFGSQDGLSLGLVSRGTVTREAHDAEGRVRSRTSEPFHTTFALRQVTGGRWMNVGVIELPDSSS
jgi:hypothetical protein